MHLTSTFTPEQDTTSKSKGVDSECCSEKQLESLFDAAVHSIHKACSPDSQQPVLAFECFDRLKNQIEEILALWPTWREKLGAVWEEHRMGEVEEMEQKLCLEAAAAATERKRPYEEPHVD